MALDPAPPTRPLALHRPGDAGYERLARPWNLAVPVRPAAVVEATSADDVVAAVRYATGHGLRVAVQCTGHGAASGIGDDVLLVATAGLDDVAVLPGGSARVGAGVRWRRAVDAIVPHGLAPLSSSALDVGVVGYLTGGGLGPMARSFGFASDRVTAWDVVTADGELRRATPTEHEDLFWGLRGGRGALGIVTAVELDLVPVVSLYGGAVWFDGADAPAVLETWRTWSAGLPEAATTSVALVREPPEGRLTVAVRFAFVGDAAEGEAHLAPIRAAATPVRDGVGVLPYEAVEAIDALPLDPMPALGHSALLAELTAATVGSLLSPTVAGSGSLLVVELRLLGGALARPGAHPSAVSHRDAAYTLQALGDAAAAVVDVVSPWTTGGRLASFGGGVRAYDTPTLARLRELMARYDPAGVLVAGDPLR